MNVKTGIAVATALSLLAAPAMMMAGCQSAEQVAAAKAAAIVNGETIAESAITDYIQSYRTTNGLDDNTQWAQWLVDNGYTPSSLRDETIDYYVRQAVIEQDAAKRNIEVSAEDIDAQISEVRDYYGYDDEQWEEQLSAIGYTVESYRDYVKQSLIQEKLADAISTDDGADDETVLSLANSYGSTINGAKYLKYIVIDKENKDQAEQAAKEAAEEGADFEALVSKYSTVTDNSKDGWDCLTSVESVVADGVAELKKGEVSKLIEGDTAYYIVKVEDVCTVPDEGFTAIDQIPKALLDEFSENAKQSAKYSNFQTYVEDLVASASIEKKEMPSDLPYDVSLEGIKSSTESLNMNEIQGIEEPSSDSASAASADSASSENPDQSNSAESANK